MPDDAASGAAGGWPAPPALATQQRPTGAHPTCRPSKATLQAVLLGQILALLIACTATASSLLAQRGVSLPTLQSALNYSLLAIVFGSIQLASRRRLSNRWSRYLLLALLDVEANYVVVLAFRYTSITSVTILDCFSIPAVVALSSLVLRSRYKPLHHVASAICVTGLAILVLGDRSGSQESTTGRRPALGDGLVLVGATLYAAANVGQELLLGDAPPSEVLAMLGLFGTVITTVQAWILEGSAAATVPWTSPGIWLPFLFFSVAMFTFYSLVPYELMLGGAALLNLSLLASDVWAAGARAALFGGFSRFDGLCFSAAFLLEILGLGLFTRAGSAHAQPTYTVLRTSTELELEESPSAAKGSDSLPL